MENLNKRLVEVECILKKLDNYNIKKIPQEIWDYIEIKKDKEYKFYYNENKKLSEQNLNIDTIAIITFINIEYLLTTQQKKEITNFLRKDAYFAEQEKSKLYGNIDIFKNTRNESKQENSLIEVKQEKWHEKVFLFFKHFFIDRNK